MTNKTTRRAFIGTLFGAGAAALVGKKLYDQFTTETPAPVNTAEPIFESTYRPPPKTAKELAERVKEIYDCKGDYEQKNREAAELATLYLSRQGIQVSSEHNIEASDFTSTTFADGTTIEALIVKERLSNGERETHYRQYTIWDDKIEYYLYERIKGKEIPVTVEQKILKVR